MKLPLTNAQTFFIGSLSRRSYGVEVVELRLGIQLPLEDEPPLVLDHEADLASRVKQVSELAGPDGADLDARRIFPLHLPGALHAEGALLDHPDGPRPVPQVMRVGVHIPGRQAGFLPVEMPRPVWARRHAVPAADAPVVIHHHDAVVFLPGRLNRTNLGARRIFTLLALDGHVEMPFLGDVRRVVILFGMLQVDPPFLGKPENPDPLDLGVAGLVVFGYAPVHAPAASDATGQVGAVPIQDPLHRLRRPDLYRLLVVFSLFILP